MFLGENVSSCFQAFLQAVSCGNGIGDALEKFKVTQACMVITMLIEIPMIDMTFGFQMI